MGVIERDGEIIEPVCLDHADEVVRRFQAAECLLDGDLPC